MTSSILYAYKRPFTVSEPYGEEAWSTVPIRVSPKSIYRLTLSAKQPGTTSNGLLSLRYHDSDGFYLGDAPDPMSNHNGGKDAAVTITLFQPPATAATATIVIGSADSQSELHVHSLRFERITRREAKKIVAERLAPYPRPAMAPAHRAAVQKNLPRTMARLAGNKPLSILILGDSIANDTYNGLLRLALTEHSPDAKLSIHLSVRGGASCQFYRHFNRTDLYVLRHKPDLVIIAGISHKRDIEAIHDVIRQVRARSDAEILFMTGYRSLSGASAFDSRLSVAGRHEHEARFKEHVRRLADLPSVASFDFTPVWSEYVAAIPDPERRIMRDSRHFNFDGKLLLAAFLASLLVQE